MLPSVPSSASYTRPATVLVLASVCCLLWGSAYPAIKQGYALFGIGPGETGTQIVFAGWRFTLAGLLLLAVTGVRRQPVLLPLRLHVGPLLLLGVTQTTLHYLFFYIGLAHTTGVKGSIMVGSTTFFSVLLAHVLYANDRLTVRRIGGCILGFAGVIGVNLTSGGLDLTLSFRGEGFVVISAFFLSASSIYGKRLSQRMDVIAMTGHQLTLGGLLLLVIGHAAGGRLQGFSPASGLLLGYLVVLSSVAFVLWSLLLKHNRVGVVAVYSFLIPVFGALLSALFLREPILELRYLAALTLVSAGIWLVNREPVVASPRPATVPPG